MRIKDVLKWGCLVSIIVLVLFFGLVFYTFIDTYDFSDSQAIETVNDSDFKKVEKYLKTHKEVQHISYKGSNHSYEEKLWQINNLLVDYDNSIIFYVPDTIFFFNKKELLNNHSVLKLRFNQYLEADTIPHSRKFSAA